MQWSLIRRKLAKVDRALDKAIEAAELPGAVVLARMPRDGEIVEHLSVRGLAVVRPERIPMTRETIFDLASLTKPIATASALLWLVHEGSVDLDAPVAKYLPAFAERGRKSGLNTRLLVSAGGAEVEERDMIKNASEFVQTLSALNLNGLNVGLTIFPDEDHASVSLASLGRALRFALPPDAPVK